MNVYKLKKFDKGREVNYDEEYNRSIAHFAWDNNTPCPKILDNYVVIVNDNDDTADIKVICGPNQGKCYKNIYKGMLVRPNLLPCFMKDAIKWQDAVNMIRDGKLPESVITVCDNVLGDNKAKVCAGITETRSRDSILTVKVLEEALEPYLGPLGLALIIKELTRRLFDEKTKNI